MSASFTGKVNGGTSAQAGVITSGSFNRCEIRVTSNGDQIEDGSGNKVYGRLTWASSVWTLTYYVFNAGAESAYSLPTSYDITIYFREVFTLATVPTVGADLGSLGSLDATADVVDATTTQRGVISTGTQSFAGNKTFTGTVTASNLSGTNTGDVTLSAFGSSPDAKGATLSGQALTLQPADATHPGLISAATQTIGGAKTFQDQITHGSKTVFTRLDDATATGANATVADGATSFLRLTNASLTSIDGFAGGQDGRFLWVENKTGASIALNDETGGTAANRIRTGTGAAATITNNSAFLVSYDGGQSRWILMAGGGGGSLTLNAVGSSPNANGATSSGLSLTLQPADSTNPGVMTAGTQTFGGAKTFAGQVTHGNKSVYSRVDDSTSTGSNATVADANTTYLRLTNASLVSIDGFAGGADGRYLFIENKTGVSINLNDETGATAANRVRTGTAAPQLIKNNSTFVIVYDGSQSRWVLMSGGNGVAYINAHLNSTNSPSVGTSDTLITFNSIEWDTSAAYSTGTGLYTAPLAGRYRISFTIITAPVNLSGTQAVNASIYKNGSNFRTMGYHIGSGSSINHVVSGNVVVDLVAGDTISLYANSSVATTLLSAAGTNYMDIVYVSGSSTLANPETVSARYTVSSFAASTTTPINYATQDYDSHSAVTTSPTAWKFTAPFTGKYSVSICGSTTSASPASMYIYKNGTANQVIGGHDNVSEKPGHGEIKLNAGDFIDIRPGAARTTGSDAQANWIAIHSIGP